ncbi:CidA/LrgA family protein [Paenibacillus thailandensis]|uniref:CidA/LrgA family protein n=1 Tax=Paenibacillus thailandensis TaxID=393250 RepID=A0ABW5QZJ0_9BACL
MKLAIGASIFILFHLAGVWVKTWLPIPLPANVIGLILLTIALFAKAVKLSWVEECGRLALKHMGLFFIPAIVGTMAFAKLFAPHLLSIAASLVAGTGLVMLVTGFVVKHIGGKERNRDESRTMAQ